MMDEKATAGRMKRASLAIIIPALNAVGTLAACLEAIEESRARFDLRVRVADGGSSDGTPELARRFGAETMTTAPGRGAQLRAGAAASDADWLLFLHADTVLAPGWSEEAAKWIADAANAARAAAFCFALDDESAAARRVEAFVAWRCRTFGSAYGDQGLLMPRRLYDEIGGYRPLVLMEDVDMMRRIGRRRLSILASKAVTSSVRYRHTGYIARGLRNLFCLVLYFARVPPKFIARIYG